MCIYIYNYCMFIYSETRAKCLTRLGPSKALHLLQQMPYKTETLNNIKNQKH